VILIDTSAWVDFFRGTGRRADAVDEALANSQAALCGPVVTELRRGIHPSQRKRVLSLLSGCPVLDQPDDLWVDAGELGAFLGRRGVSVKTLDLLIAAYALFHDVELLTGDGDFKSMLKAGIGLRLS